MLLYWYARQVATRPLWIIGIVFVFTAAWIVSTFLTTTLPSFDDPLLGFEARGTPLSQRTTAWKNLLSSSGWSGPLTLYPGSANRHLPNLTSPWQALEERRVRRSLPASGPRFFCSDPGRDYAQVIFQGWGKVTNLFTAEGLRSLCRLDQEILRRPSDFAQLCEQSAGHCCPSWSVANYVAQLRNLSSCLAITPADVKAVGKLVRDCSRYYFQMKLSHDCAAEPAVCRGVPRRCFNLDSVYNILHYLADVGFGHDLKLTYTALFLPVPQSTAVLPYYSELTKSSPLGDNVTRMVAMELGLKYALFDRCLVRDSYHLAVAATLIFLLLWAYCASLLVTLSVLASVLASLGLAYSLYTLVFRIPCFPFMNIMVVIIAIGIGADDACVYSKLWACSKMSGSSLQMTTTETLHHALASMFVTSITTSLAFYGSAVSQVTAITCFSIFAGTAVLAHLLYTITWLPTAVVLAEKWCSWKCCLYLHNSWLCNCLWRLHHSLLESSRIIFEKLLPCILIKPRYLWLFFLTTLAIGGSVAVFYYPQLRLPDSKVFQIFSSDHPFEMYDLHLKHLFWFEKAKERELSHMLPLRFVWGVLPVDNGHYLDPFSRGSLVLDPMFNMAAQESQVWLLRFCRELRSQDFYLSTPGPLLSNCFIETFKSWMVRRCVDGITNTNRTPCCQTSAFPYSEPVFRRCLKEAISILHHTPGYFYLPALAGPRFDSKTAEVKAFVVEYESNHTYSSSYVDMHKFYTKVEGWFRKQLSDAPPGLRNGWFISDLEFYDLQDSLWRGTLAAIGLAVGIAFVSVLVTTFNPLLSLFAILTIAGIILTTLGGLVVLGWKLNILESVTTSVAIGLAVDLTLHYGVAYRMAPSDGDREASVVFTLSRVGTPVAMAAFTTFLAGLALLASVVLAYIQVATFLTLLITSSWCFATFFFLPLLSRFGPSQPHCCPSQAFPELPQDKVSHPCALSESTLSTSSASYYTQLPTSESHELEPLALLGGRLEKYPTKKQQKRSNAANWRANRKRSVSFSLDPKMEEDPAISIVSQNQRKTSLPSVHFTFEDQRSPAHSPWTKREISV